MNRPALECPHCHRTLKSKKPIAAGKRIQCPACSQPFVVDETEPESVDESAELAQSLDRFIHWAGIGMIATGVFWAAVPSILITTAVVAIPGFRLFIVGIGILLVFFSLPVLFAGFCLYRQKPRWFVLPGCLIAGVVGLATVGWVLFSMDQLMNEFKGFPPPDFAGRVGVALTFAILLLGPLSMLSGLAGLGAFMRAQLTSRKA